MRGGNYRWNGQQNPPPPGFQSGCFSEQMLVTTENGWEPFGNIQPGVKVSSFDPANGQVAPRRVYKKLTFKNREIWRLQADGIRQIETTCYHPFLTSRGWVATHRLRENDVLLGINGLGKLQRHRIHACSRTDARMEVVNLITEREHTFMVNGLVVHNYSWARSARTLFSEVWAALGGYQTDDPSLHAEPFTR